MSFATGLRIAVGIVILCLVIAILWLWRDKDNAAASLIEAQSAISADANVHKDDLATIAKITAFRKADDAILVQYADNLRQIDAKFNTIDTSIEHLRMTNAEVARWFDTPIPADLLAVLNGVPDTAASSSVAK